MSQFDYFKKTECDIHSQIISGTKKEYKSKRKTNFGKQKVNQIFFNETENGINSTLNFSRNQTGSEVFI
jgi:hypothetical protein